MLWLWQRESVPWFRRLLMTAFVVSLLVFVPTPCFLAREEPYRFVHVNLLERVVPVAVSFFCLTIYGVALVWRRRRRPKWITGPMLAQAWPAVGLGAIVAILLGSVLASAYATAPNRLRRLPTTWTSEDRADHYREVMAEMQRAVAAAPACAAAHSNFGRALAECGRFDEAIKQFERALEIEPGNAKTPNNLAAALAARGRFAEAIAQLQTVLAREPDNVQVLSSLANVLASAGRPQEAIQHYQKVLTIAPCSPEVETSLAIALLAGGRYVEAVSHFCHAAELAPYNPRCQLNLAWFRATCPIAALRNGAEAVEHAQRASQLGDGNNVEVLDTLAAAYAEAGRFPEAANAARQALDLARQQDSRSLAAVLRTRLVLYEAGKPFHESPPASVNLQTK